MVGGYTFISILAISIPIGFFKPGPLDDLTIKFNLDESTKGYERDEAHDYESSLAHRVFIANHLDQYIKGVIHLKEEKHIDGLDIKNIEYYIEAKDLYKTEINVPDESLWTVDASIIGNKYSINGSHYKSGEFTKKIKETIFDSAKNLIQLMKFAGENLVLPEFQNYMDNLIQEVDTIYQNIGEWMKEEEKILVYEIQTKMVKSHNELFFLRQTLTLLAKETIIRSNRIIRLFKKLKQDDHQFNKKALQLSAKRMKKLLTRSFSILEDAIKTFKKIGDDVKIVKEKIQALFIEIGNMDEEENEALIEWIHWRRSEAYGGATGCILLLPTCLIAYPVAYKIVEDNIAKERAKFKKLALSTKVAQKDAYLLFVKIDEKSKYVEKELTLIRKWSIHVRMVQETGFEPENIVDYLEIKEDKKAIENLCKLNKACKEYIDHHLPGLEDLEIVSPPLDEACLADGVLQQTLKCKPYNTHGRAINFYKIVRGQDPDHHCVVQVDPNPFENGHLKPTKYIQ